MSRPGEAAVEARRQLLVEIRLVLGSVALRDDFSG